MMNFLSKAFFICFVQSAVCFSHAKAAAYSSDLQVKSLSDHRLWTKFFNSSEDRFEKRLDFLAKIAHQMRDLHESQKDHQYITLSQIMIDPSYGSLIYIDYKLSSLKKDESSTVQYDVLYNFGTLIWEVMTGTLWSEGNKEFEPLEGQIGNLKYSIVWPKNFVDMINDFLNQDASHPPSITSFLLKLENFKQEFSDEILKSLFGSNQIALNFWKDFESSRSIFNPISWEDFAFWFFYNGFGKMLPTAQSKEMLHLAYLLGIFKSNPMVSLEYFVKMYSAFGPLNDFDTFFQRIKDNFIRGNFQIKSYDEANEYLDLQENGIYLVHYSDVQGVAFVLSFIRDFGIVHVRILKDDQALFFVDFENLRQKKFTSLVDCINEMKNQFELKEGYFNEARLDFSRENYKDLGFIDKM